MNRETARYLAPLMKAYGDGKEIEVMFNGEWEGCKDPMFVHHAKYRIKPKPIECYLEMDGRYPIGIWDELPTAESFCQSPSVQRKFIKVREVMDGDT